MHTDTHTHTHKHGFRWTGAAGVRESPLMVALWVPSGRSWWEFLKGERAGSPPAHPQTPPPHIKPCDVGMDFN